MRFTSAFARAATVTAATAALVIAVAAPGHAAEVVAEPATLGQVVDNLRNWLVGLLVGLATLFLTVGGVRYIAANGDPGQVERAKSALRSAAVGYALAALAPLLVSTLKSVLGV